MTAFKKKGRFAEVLAEVPVHIILEPKTALCGASTLALNNRVMRRSDA